MGRTHAAMAVLAGLGLAVGCASQGPLQPPSLHLPAPAERLAAERVGGQVILDWTTPAKTTDGELIKGAMAANVCLDLDPEGSKPPAAAKKGSARKGVKKTSSGAAPTAAETACYRVAHLPVTPGPSHAVAELGPELSAGPSRVVAYQIELENAKGRSAGVSAPVFVAAGAAPSAVTGLNLSSRRESVLVAWKSEPGTATMELKRTLIATAAGPVDAAAAKAAAKTKAPAPFSPGAAKTPAREVVLRPDMPLTRDTGGMIDNGVRDGDTYTYVAQRVLTVTLASHTLELRGVPSAPATVAFHDTFPPRPPTGLVLVPGGGFGEPPSIDLVWDSNFEADLLGYNVYRSQGGGDFVKLNVEPLPAPSYRDMRVEPGQQYTYRVTAIDQRHNESAPGGVATESLRK